VESLGTYWYVRKVAGFLRDAGYRVLKPKILKWQKDGWRCGYYAFWTAWRFINSPPYPGLLEAVFLEMPKEFDQFVRDVLTAQAEGKVVTLTTTQRRALAHHGEIPEVSFREREVILQQTTHEDSQPAAPCPT
jgi:hypothetical protein